MAYNKNTQRDSFAETIKGIGMVVFLLGIVFGIVTFGTLFRLGLL